MKMTMNLTKRKRIGRETSHPITYLVSFKLPNFSATSPGNFPRLSIKYVHVTFLHM